MISGGESALLGPPFSSPPPEASGTTAEEEVAGGWIDFSLVLGVLIQTAVYVVRFPRRLALLVPASSVVVSRSAYHDCSCSVRPAGLIHAVFLKTKMLFVDYELMRNEV